MENVAEQPIAAKDCAPLTPSHTANAWIALLEVLANSGVKAWLDSGSLLGIIRHGQLNAWEKDIDLGIWIEDFRKTQEACRKFAAEHGFFYRELRLRGIPYVILLDVINPASGSSLPLALHIFYRVGTDAWSPQPNSLAWAKARYPRYKFSRALKGSSNIITGALSFVRHEPRHTVAILLAKLGATKPIAAWIKQQSRKNWPRGKHLADGPIGRYLFDFFQWVVPAALFEDLKPLEGHPSHVLAPASRDEYLTMRYNNWRKPVKRWNFLVDDGCIFPMSSSRFDSILREIRSQLDSIN